MLTTALLIIIAVSLLVSGAVVVRHFPKVAQLNLEHLPKEQEGRKKRELLTKRLDSEGEALRQHSQKYLRPFQAMWSRLQTRFRRYVYRIEKLWHHERTLHARRHHGRLETPATESVTGELRRAESAFAGGQYEAAEAGFIAAAKLDPKNSEAYRGLAKTYAVRELWEEARQTYLFLTKLTPGDDKVYAALGEIAERAGDVQKAIEYYEQAVVLNDALSPRFYHLAELLLKVNQPEVAREAIISALGLEPKSPKYLDLLVETAILCGDAAAAEEALHELRLVNPENQKLAEFKERIKEIQ